MENRRNKSGPHQKRGHQKDQFDLKEFNQNITSWIQEEFAPSTIEFAENFGEYLVRNRLTTSQIRNIYGEIKRIEAKVTSNDFGEVYKDFLLLKPKLAYAAKRAGTRGIEDFKKVMDAAHSAVIDLSKEKRVRGFRNFTDLFEAILAYHKAAGGRE